MDTRLLFDIGLFILLVITLYQLRAFRKSHRETVNIQLEINDAHQKLLGHLLKSIKNEPVSKEG